MTDDDIYRILKVLADKQGPECLRKIDSHKFIRDYYPEADKDTIRKLKMAFRSGAFRDFYDSDDFDRVVSVLMNENFWTKRVACDVAMSFAKALGIDVVACEAVSDSELVVVSPSADSVAANEAVPLRIAWSKAFSIAAEVLEIIGYALLPVFKVLAVLGLLGAYGYVVFRICTAPLI